MWLDDRDKIAKTGTAEWFHVNRGIPKHRASGTYGIKLPNRKDEYGIPWICI